MAAIKFNKIIYSLILVLICVNFSYAAYPEFEFSESNYPTGQVDVLAKSSAGTKVDLFINENFIGTKNIFADNVEVILDGSSISNEIVNIYSTITFRNDDPARVYRINISNGPYKDLFFGGSLEFRPSVVEVINYRDEESGESKSINVVDDLVELEFTNVNSYMNNGDNEFKFVQKYPTPSFSEQLESVHTVSFEKFSNTITVNDFVNSTNQRTIKLSGYVDDSSNPLHYLLNMDPKNVANTAALQDIDLTSGLFNFSISNLKEGLNQIYLVTTSPSNSNIFTGQELVEVIVDTQDPKIEIVSAIFSYDGEERSANLNSGNAFVNGRSLELFILTDAYVMNYTFNGKNYSEEIEAGNVTIDLNLEEGQNNLTLRAIDLAGNIFKEQHNIFYSGDKPKIDRDSLKPAEMFKENVAHFFFQDIEGKTNRPGMDITIFTIDGEAKTLSGGSVTCEKYKEMFVRNLGQLDRDKVDGPEYNSEEFQLSLTNFMFQKTTVKTDSNGEFEAMIGLQERDFDRGDYREGERENKNNPKVDSVRSRNTICFVMQDQYGYTEIHEERVDLDAGNTMWKPEEITTIPNTMYASEIEQTGDVREGTGNAEFGMIARFSYIGPGKVEHLTSFRIGIDKSVSSENADFKIDTGRVNYRLDKNTGEMIVYAPVIVYPMNIKPLDYPESIVFGFEARPTYTVGDKDIPIDEKNPIYFKTSINIERPLDHTKWLTPSMIEDTQEFLNKTIEFTKQAAEYMQYAAIGGVLTCTGAKFYYGALMATAQTDAERQEYERDLYRICDRVACTASPQKCEGTIGDFNNTNAPGIVEMDGKGPLTSNQIDEAGGTVTDANGGTLQRFDGGATVGGPCDANGDGNTSDGAFISGTVTNFENEAGSWYLAGGKKSTEYIDGRCVPAQYGENGNLKAIDLKGVGGACFSTNAPYYDDTRCNFFVEDEGAAGWDPADNIIESIRCGCITDTYSHLKNYLKIQEGIYMCLEQAKIGDIKGSYCERLMGQAVCDIATNIIFKTLTQKSTRGNSGGEEESREVGFVNAVRGAQNGDALMNKRYEGSNLKLTGLSTDQIVNKACLGALTGDWSILTDNILTAIEQNEVDPVFGPMLPESRMQGYNPITGALSINYRFTYAAISGGQYIRTKVSFVCDPNAPNNQYCPQGAEYIADNIDVKTLTVSKGGTRQDTIVVTDPKAKYWYNVIRLEHEYEIDGKKETRPQVENIMHKGEIIAACSFSATASATGAKGGFSCDSLFDDSSLLSMYTIDSVNLVPSVQNVYYPGNNIFVDLAYSINGQGSQNSFVLAYKAICQGKEGGQAMRIGTAEIGGESNSGSGGVGVDTLAAGKSLVTGNYGDAIYDAYGSISGRAIVPITEIIPNELGGIQNTKSYIFKYKISDNITLLNKKLNGDENYDNEGYILRFKNADPAKRSVFRIEGFNGMKFNTQGTIPNHASGDLGLEANDYDEDYDIYITEFTSQNLEITISGEDYQNLIVSIENHDGDSFKTPLVRSFGPPTKVDLTNNQEYSGPLQEGACDLKLRILPRADSAITVQNFETYLPGGANADNIEVSDNLDIVNMKTLRFNLQNKPLTGNQVQYFEVVRPYNSASYCYEDVYSEGKIEGNAIYQSSDGSVIDGLKLNYRISTILAGKPLANATIKSPSTDKNGVIGFNMNLDKVLLKSLFETNDRIEAVVSVDVIGSETGTNSQVVKDFRKSVEPKKIIISKCTGGKIEEKPENSNNGLKEDTQKDLSQ